MKGVVLAGGTGSRLYPLTRITNKHLLPIFDRPMASWAVESLVRGGITEVMVVTGGTHAGEFLRLFGDGHGHDCRLSYAYQENAAGIADALGLAERFVGDDRFAVLLADNVFEHSVAPSVQAFAAQDEGARILLVASDDVEHLRHLGVADLDDSGRIKNIIEKPEEPPSKFGVTGLYFYDPQVFEIVHGLTPSERGELEITDVNNWYVERSLMEHDVIDGFWGDAGESVDAYYLVNDFVRANGANK